MWRRLAPVAALLLLAPLIAEFFSGSTSITMLLSTDSRISGWTDR